MMVNCSMALAVNYTDRHMLPVESIQTRPLIQARMFVFVHVCVPVCVLARSFMLTCVSV